MLDLGGASFVMDGPPLGEERLRSYALDLFQRFDRETSKRLALQDFGLELEIEEGSIKGRGKIVAVAALVYAGIAQYGSFVQGVREIKGQAIAAADWLVEAAPTPSFLPTSRITRSRRNTGALGEIERLFVEVGQHRMTPAEAIERARTILDKREDPCPDFLKAAAEAFLTAESQAPQLVLPDAVIQAQLELPSLPARPNRRERAPRESPLPADRWKIAIRKEHRGEEEIVTITHLN